MELPDGDDGVDDGKPAIADDDLGSGVMQPPGEFFERPAQIANDVYRWGTDFDVEKFLTRLEVMMRAATLPGGLYPQSATTRSVLGNTASGLRELRLPILQQGVTPETYSQFGVTFSPAEAQGGKPKWLEESFPTWHGLGGPLYGQKEYGKFVRAYLGTIASVDDSVGRLHQTLKDSGQLDKTLIIFTSDNGFAIGEHGRVDKRTAYEESLRIPFLVRYPPLARAGAVVDEMVLSLDLAPTLLDVCGTQPLPKADGRSWKPLLAGKTADWRSAFFYQYNYEEQFPYTPNVRAVRTKEWKYIRYPHGDGKPDRHAAELYTLKGDPLEKKNLASDAAHAAKVKQLRELLDQLMKEHDALPDKMPLDGGIKNVLPKY